MAHAEKLGCHETEKNFSSAYYNYIGSIQLAKYT